MTEHIASPATFSSEAVQNGLVTEMTQKATVLSFHLTRSLDAADTDNALNLATNLIDILRTSDLTPRNYYAIYHLVSTSLFQFAIYLNDQSRFSDRKIAEMYEVVQYNRCCLHRLYLMIAIAPELAARGIVAVTDILDDLTDMTRAAQDPIRALFLRHFLLSVFKQYLPDSNPKETEQSLQFLLNNFAQMNRLWVRIEDLMAADERKSQREEFSVLIGTNIQRISSLKGLTLENYSSIIFPFLSKHVELCEDALSQEFILRSIVHAFPEDYHIASVEVLFPMFGKVEQGVRILSIVNQLLERFLAYVGDISDKSRGRKIFVAFAKNIEELFNAEGHLGLTDKFETLQRLLRFALRTNPGDTKNVKNLLHFTDVHIELAIGDETLDAPEASLQLRRLIEVPVADGMVRELDSLPKLMSRLRMEDRIEIAKASCAQLTERNVYIKTKEDLDFVMAVTKCLLEDRMIYDIIHLIRGDRFGLIKAFAESVSEAFDEHAILPIGLALTNLLNTASESDERAILKYIMSFGKSYEDIGPAQVAQLYVEVSRVEIANDSQDFAETFIDAAIRLYDDIPKIKAKSRLGYMFINLLLTTSEMPEEQLEIVCSQTESVSKASNDVKGVIATAFLYWRKDGLGRDINKVQDRLQVALDLALGIKSQGDGLKELYYVLDSALFMLEKGYGISMEWVNELIDKIADRHDAIQASGQRISSVVSAQTRQFYVNMVKYMDEKGLVPEDA